ncbi:hypothetical protein K7H20_23010 [Salipiger manganoxidans]|uniref:hypothetical protein n=1 Tax=Salipiger marinus TaxID=555512 RepID=UPI001E3F76C0|nr:hypothetical protein [Salipiger manganoxidans]MCD1620928.1 hypothetical protein [Salipiger manganoxidans]
MMDLKMLKAAELDAEYLAAKSAYWRYVELHDMRVEEQKEDEALHCDTDGYDQEIDRLSDKIDAAAEKMAAMFAEKSRRSDLSNHARLIEEAMRGEVPA